VFFRAAAEKSNFTAQVVVTPIGEHEPKGLGVKLNHQIEILAKEAKVGELCIRWSVHGFS